MKTKSIIITKFLFLLVVMFTSFSNLFAQVPEPDKSTSDALPSIFNRAKKTGKYNFDDRSSIQNNIKIAFLIWNQKGEFEKQMDYESRIQKQSQIKFTEICIEEIEKKIKTFTSSDLNINLLTYDAENEFFPTVFKFKEKEWKIKLEILINEAQNFKEKEWQKLEWQNEESEWCFIHNDLFPSKIYLKSNSYIISYKLPLSNQEVIKFAFNDLGIENLYLKNFIFIYSKATDNEKENDNYSSDVVASVRKNYEIVDRLDGNGGYLLGGRKVEDKKNIEYKCDEEGTVVVSIEVDRNGKVISATPGVQGTTNNSKCILDTARILALETKFNIDPKAPVSQMGKIIYRFSF